MSDSKENIIVTHETDLKGCIFTIEKIGRTPSGYKLL